MSSITPFFAPAGSVIAKVLPDGEPEMFIPFFSTHFMMPIKVGEVIWVVYPDDAISSAAAIASEAEGVSVTSKTMQGGTSEIGSEITALRQSQKSAGPFRRAVVIDINLAGSHLYPIDPAAPRLDVTNSMHSHHGGYWITRITGTRLSEDLNFTHLDRDLDLRAMCRLQGKEPSDVLGPPVGDDPARYFAEFPNGITAALPADAEVSSEDITVKNNSCTFGDKIDEYLKIQENDTSVREPVPPPFKRRGSEFVLNGSNNTRIVLGTDGSQRSCDWDAEPGENLSRGVITLSVGSGLSGTAAKIVPSPSLSPKGVYEHEKCPELREDMKFTPGDPLYSNWMAANQGIDDPVASLTIKTYTDATDYIDAADGLSTFPSTVVRAEDREKQKNTHQIDSTEEIDIDPLVYEEGLNYDQGGSLIIGEADHIRLGARESLRIGVDGGAEIILHRDGNIFIKPGGELGQVYIGGGPSDLVDELGTSPLEGEEGVATYCDVVTYPSGDPTLGLAAEMGMINKLPTPAPVSGRRYSPRVKVKS